MLFKISPIQTLISATTVFNHSSVIFDPTELCLTILESLGRGEKHGVFEFVRKRLNKKWELLQGFERSGCRKKSWPPINFSFQYVIEWFLTVLEMSRMSWNWPTKALKMAYKRFFFILSNKSTKEREMRSQIIYAPRVKAFGQVLERSVTWWGQISWTSADKNKI